ncbi:MAG: polysaccharide biosynthesis protein [Clostridium sp.]|nr:polysaccharide biosynthesis protein [Clostridium sp.]
MKININIRRSILLLIDFISILLSYFIGYCIRFKFVNTSISSIWKMYNENLFKVIVIASIYICFYIVNKQYRSIWKFASIDEFISGIASSFLSLSIVLIVSLIDKKRIPLLVSVIAAVIIILLCLGSKSSYRVFKRIKCNMEIKKDTGTNRVLVVGAGSAGAIVINECKRKPNCKKKVVALIDDDKNKLGTYISGVEVLGDRSSIPFVVKNERIDEIIIAITNLSVKDLKDILEECNYLKVKVKIIPSLSEIINGKFTIKKIRDVSVEDLLDREPVRLDLDGISNYIEDKVIIVTGGGGSIGSELCRQLVKFKPKELIIFDIYENNAYDIQNELLALKTNVIIRTLIGSVRDKKRLRGVFAKYKPNIVFHAAAHKHVPLMEDNPMEAIKNNVLGTLNLAEVSNNFNVERFVLISTDKAVNPTNIMGASKRICEMIIQGINRESKTEFVAVRFGNVLGSNGSVVPLFKKQIEKGGPITLTHKEITRYFMTIPEAAQLVLQAGAFAIGGEIFVLDMGEPVKIYDLAENLIRLSGLEVGKDIDIKITGLRPGEKLYEELLMNEEGLRSTEHKKIFIGKPSDIEFADLKAEINKLMNIVSLGNVQNLKIKLQEIVPTYKYLDGGSNIVYLNNRKKL